MIVSITYIPFKFKFDYLTGIKGCAVFPVYASESGFKLFGSGSSKKTFESKSIIQTSDNKSQPRAIGVGGSNNEND